MKKFLFVLVALFMLSMSVHADNVFTNSVDTIYHDGKAMIDSVYHDGKAVVSTVYDDMKSATGTIYPDVKSAVISIGKAIGVAAEHVYTVLVKKYFVIGVKEAAVFLLSLASIILGLVMWRKYTKDNQPVSYSLLVPLTFLILGVIVVCNVDYDAMLMGIINPEYGAINYILEYTKGLVK